MAKKRLDVLIVEQGFFENRSKAQAAIMAGQVLVNDLKVDKPGTQVTEEVKIKIIGNKLPYVSRGGLKLEKALKVFPISLKDKIIADIGASTGGFTDCSLQNGARKVYAIDVGYGQLAWSLRNDERVVNMERTNVRYLDESSLPEKIQVATIDVAFISLAKVLPAVRKLLSDDGCVIALIKPQFEAGRDKVGKKGVVRDAKVHEEVIEKVINMARDEKFGIGGLDYSPIKGPEGNIEYLLYLTSNENDNIDAKRASQIVALSHGTLEEVVEEKNL
ncbi:MAG: TlyA family RNA methyltransferase [Acidaminococcaceae bacterium]